MNAQAAQRVVLSRHGVDRFIERVSPGSSPTDVSAQFERLKRAAAIVTVRSAERPHGQRVLVVDDIAFPLVADGRTLVATTCFRAERSLPGSSLDGKSREVVRRRPPYRRPRNVDWLAAHDAGCLVAGTLVN